MKAKGKKKEPSALGSSKVKMLQAMIESDSDSYGSEGGLKPKPVVIKKRGGRKRKKGGEAESQATLDQDFGAEQEEMLGDDVSEVTVVGDAGPGKIEMKIEEEKMENRGAKISDNASTQGTSHEKSEASGETGSSQAARPTGGNASLAKPSKTSAREESPRGMRGSLAKPKGAYQPVRSRPYSPPMIKEYDPNEHNAKTRAKMRAEAIKKREAALEIDQSLYPEHPTPWKGRPSEFFILHAPRRGGGAEKVLNNSQKEFILIYYPESVVSDVSLMEFLYKQAKDHEDRERWAQAEKEKAAAGLGRKGRKRTRGPKHTQTVKILSHTNKDSDIRSEKPMSFESLWQEEEQANHQRQFSYAERASDTLVQLRRQIDQISSTATSHYSEAQILREQHAVVASPAVGFCVHCQSHGGAASYAGGVVASTVYDEVEIQRQNILHQICEAKKRQARREADEARRLHDEARRLAEQADILELEAQRPLLEAKKLELEARALEQQLARIPSHAVPSQQSTATHANLARSQPPGSAISAPGLDTMSLYMQQRAQMQSRQAQLAQAAQNTQADIERLQASAKALEQRAVQPRLDARKTISEDMRPLYEALEGVNSKKQQEQNKAPKMVISQNSLAAKAAAAAKEQPTAAPRRTDFASRHASAPATKKASGTSKKRIETIAEEHNYSYGEEDEEDAATRDPVLNAAQKEFERAKKAFEAAQKAQEDAQRKQEERIRKQQDEIRDAQEATKKYFEEAKKKQEEEKSLKAPADLRAPKKQVAAQDSECDRLLSAFNDYVKQLRLDGQGLNRRYQNRDDIYDFLGPILSGKVLKDFDDTDGYVNFHGCILTDNFVGGHREYLTKWRNLFLYETYSFLMNSRWSKFSGSDLDLRNQLLKQSQEKAMCWKGYLQYAKMEGKFCTLRLFKEPPNVYSYSLKNKNYSKIYDDPDRHEGENFELSHCREDDLIVISKFRVNLEGQDDIKMVSGGAQFLKEVLSKAGVVFGYVARANTRAENFVELYLDGKQAGQFQSTGEAAKEANGNEIFTRYCYHFESLLTSLREFRALKAVEFTRMAPILAYPTLSLEYKEQLLDTYCGAIESGFGCLDAAPDLNPKFYEADEQKQVHQMNAYLIKNHPKFNKSQAKVLEQIIEMPKDDILLIQGPPGTGKTHTIIGIVSMIMSTRIANNSKSKIMVCAPSNAAIDQIVMRIIDRGLVGLNGLHDDKEDEDETDEEYELPDLSQTLIRITAAEHQTESAIKKHTLEQRIIKKLCIEKFGDLKKCIKDLKEMIVAMNDFDSWEDHPEYPYVSKVKFLNYTKTLKNSHLKTVDNWGDQSLTRAQQLHTMEQQLKTHTQELADFKSGQNIHQGNLEWKEAEKAIISEANIICCTLSMAGSTKLDRFANQFEYLIVDEACQSTEPSTLIPFRLCPKRVILVGDQKQLPATTFSGNSAQTGYCRSLFERLLDAGFDKTMLTIQFRMHPKIRAFPSEQFYGGAITDHPSIGLRSPPMTISNLATVFASRIIFFDIQNSDEVYDNKSKCNHEEADFVKVLVDFIARKSSLQGTLKYIQGQIGVISPYKAQVRQLRARLEKLCTDQGCNLSETVEVNTVDAFQGSEKDIIVFSCVRSNFESLIEKSLGFLLDERRLNVAITRPKFFLFMVGNQKTLRKSDVWDNMLNYCQQQGQLISIHGRDDFSSLTTFKRCVLPQLME